MKTKIILAVIILLLLFYGVWYAFMFIAPIASFALMAGAIIVLIYLPLKTKNEKS